MCEISRINIYFSVSIVLLAVTAILGIPLGPSRTNWEYTFLDVNIESNDTALVHAATKFQVIRRGQYGLTGYMNFSETLMDGNSMIEIRISYNARYNKNFEKTPLKVPRGTILSFMNGFYRKHLMTSLTECSNAPQSSTPWDSLESMDGQYNFEKCVINPGGFSKMLTQGYYLMEAVITRVRAPYLQAIIAITMKVDSSLR